MSVPANSSIKTYRYLRLAMIAMIGLLATSLVIEWWKTGRSCLQTSISAYYYTPAQAIFVGTLITIGACMVVLKGSTEPEDILLNVAGMLAPAVALVPTPGQGSCRSVPATFSDPSANIANNMLALYIVGAPCLLLVAVFVLRNKAEFKYVAGLATAAAVFVGGIVWFFWNRDGFKSGAHYTAALAMFLCIIVVVIVNARQYHRKPATESKPASRNPYALIAVAMVVLPLLLAAYNWIFGWDHAVLWIEGVLIALFALFWISQTKELWNEGLRPEAGAPEEAGTPDQPSPVEQPGTPNQPSPA